MGGEYEAAGPGMRGFASSAPRARTLPRPVSGVQVNSNCEQLSTEEADCSGIAGAARQLIREPPLAFAWIIVEKQVGRAGVPASPQPMAQFQAHARTTGNIANVPSFLAVLCHDPKLPAHESVAHGGTARLSGLAAGRFQESISWRDEAERKQKLDGRVEQVFLKKVDDAMFHCLVLVNENYIFTLGARGEPEMKALRMEGKVPITRAAGQLQGVGHSTPRNALIGHRVLL